MARLASRRGSALVLVLLMTLAVAALAIAAIFMSGSAGLLSRFYDKERQFSYAAQSGLERVLARLRNDSTYVFDSTGYQLALDQTALVDADGTTIATTWVKVWIARTFDTTSTGPVTLSLLAQVSDNGGTRLVRRMDVRREAYSAYALVVNGDNDDSPFVSSSFIAGRIHSNIEWEGAGGSPRYRDSVSSAEGVGGAANQYLTGAFEDVRVIPWPDEDSILERDSLLAAAQGLALALSGYATRIEFVWQDDGDLTPERNEGYARVFELVHWDDERLEASDSDGQDGNVYYSYDASLIQNQCGAFYYRNGSWQFFPVATHRASWAWSIIDSAGGTPAPPTLAGWGTTANRRTSTVAILARATARCFPAGSPYLLNTERFTDAAGNPSLQPADSFPWGVRNAAHRYGGSDTTLTDTVRTCTVSWTGTECTSTTTALGRWKRYSGSVLLPLDHDGEGAQVFADDNIYVSGVVAGRVSLSVRGEAWILDRITHAAGPNTTESDCNHLFGLVAENHIRIVDNAMSARRRVGNNSTNTWFNASGADHFVLDGSYFSLTGAFRAYGFDRSTSNASGNQLLCAGALRYAGGCLEHTGSAAMESTREFSSNTGKGFRWTLTPDACTVRGYRAPNYPLTNRYRPLRTVDVRPASIIGGSGLQDYFASLQGSSDVP
jgi:hypothetical protein